MVSTYVLCSFFYYFWISICWWCFDLCRNLESFQHHFLNQFFAWGIIWVVPQSCKTNYQLLQRVWLFSIGKQPYHKWLMKWRSISLKCVLTSFSVFHKIDTSWVTMQSSLISDTFKIKCKSFFQCINSNLIFVHCVVFVLVWNFPWNGTVECWFDGSQLCFRICV